MTNALSLRPGDRVPDFALPGPRRQAAQVHLVVHRRAGRPGRGRRSRQISMPSNSPACRAPARTAAVGRRGRGGNAVAAAAGALGQARRIADGPLLLCDAERKFVPALLAQGGVGFGQPGMGLRMRVIVLDPNQRIAATFDSRPCRRRPRRSEASPTPCAATAARDQVMLHADGARPGAAARVRAASSAPR